ncbi:MAG: hypothetical protein SVP52_08985, partial [Chloroflexota bacterium]|nr:hypothetical protein [Chloroflexota bacterium]
MKILKKPLSLKIFLSSVLFIMTACQPQAGNPTPGLTIPVDTATPTDQPQITPTLAPLKSLTICTAALPENLFPYHATEMDNKGNILSLIYETPFVETNGELDSVILEGVPNQSNGTLTLMPVSVQPGQTVVDAKGQLAVLKA